FSEQGGDLDSIVYLNHTVDTPKYQANNGVASGVLSPDGSLAQ
ncbi:hypothetical protein T265_16330, partial [Opisthorchis viverrini]